jgi:YD repeat-containing protein
LLQRRSPFAEKKPPVFKRRTFVPASSEAGGFQTVVPVRGGRATNAAQFNGIVSGPLRPAPKPRKAVPSRRTPDTILFVRAGPVGQQHGLRPDVQRRDEPDHDVGSGYNSYDAAGNQEGVPGATYPCDGASRIKTVDGGSTATYAYDGDGRRVKKIAAGVTTRYLHDPDGQPVWLLPS